MLKRTTALVAFGLWSVNAFAQSPTESEIQLRFQLGKAQQETAIAQAQLLEAQANASKRDKEWAGYSRPLWDFPPPPFDEHGKPAPQAVPKKDGSK